MHVFFFIERVYICFGQLVALTLFFLKYLLMPSFFLQIKHGLEIKPKSILEYWIIVNSLNGYFSSFWISPWLKRAEFYNFRWERGKDQYIYFCDNVGLYSPCFTVEFYFSFIFWVNLEVSLKYAMFLQFLTVESCCQMY